MHTVGNNRQSIGTKKPVRDNIIPRRSAVAHDPIGFLEARQNVFRDSLEHARSRLAIRFDQATKCVEVMARHDCRTGWQVMQEMRVAVIHHMVEIEASVECLNESGIVPPAIQEAIGREQAGRISKPREPTKEGGTYTGRRDRLGVESVQVHEQHLADQVHARPFLFRHVANERQARMNQR